MHFPLLHDLFRGQLSCLNLKNYSYHLGGRRLVLVIHFHLDYLVFNTVKSHACMNLLINIPFEPISGGLFLGFTWMAIAASPLPSLHLLTPLKGIFCLIASGVDMVWGLNYLQLEEPLSLASF